MSDPISFKTLHNNTNAKWWKDPGMRVGMMHIFILYTAIYSLGYDGSLLNGVQALTPWARDFNSPKGYRLGLIAGSLLASYYLPKIPTAFLAPYLADRFGRKLVLYLAAILMLAGAFVGGFSHNSNELIGSRILLGVGTASGQIASSSLVPELAHPRIRSYAGGFLNTTYYIGSIFAAWITFAMVYYPGGASWAWRVPTLVQGLGPLLLFVGVYFVPQSPRWLIKNGREEEAHEILATYHANGDRNDPLVLLEMKEIKAAIEIEKLTATASWMTFFSTPGMRIRFYVILLVGTATQLVGNGIVGYYLSPVLKQVGITHPAQINGINGGLAVWNWFVAMSGASLVEKFGRRPLFLVSTLGMLVSFVVMTGVAGGYASNQQQATGVAVVPMLYLFMGFYSLALTPLPVLYVPEISPLTLRAKAAGLLVLSQNVSQAFNQFVNPIALAAITWKYYIVYDAVLVFYLVMFWFLLRETKGLTTEEAAVVYDDEQSRALALATEKQLHEQAHGAYKEKDVGHVEHLDSKGSSSDRV